MHVPCCFTWIIIKSLGFGAVTCHVDNYNLVLIYISVFVKRTGHCDICSTVHTHDSLGSVTCHVDAHLLELISISMLHIDGYHSCKPGIFMISFDKF